MVTKVTSAMSDAETRNDIINGGLVVNQENNTAPTDDDYTIGDLFLHVGEGTPVMSLETDGPQGTRPWQKMVLDANAQGGLVYFLSNDDIQDYIANGKMSFGIQLKTTAATISNARIGILKWVGTADAVTSDVVATWASDGTDPTLATSWSYENTPANLSLTTSWARHTVENITVDSDATNMAVFIWTDDGTITASDVIGFSEWQMNSGATVNDFTESSLTDTLTRVHYYYERETFDGASSEHTGFVGMMTSGATAGSFPWQFRQKKRITPAMDGSDFDLFKINNTSTEVLGHGTGSVLYSSTGTTGTRFQINIDGTQGGLGTITGLMRNGTSAAWIGADARL